MSYGNRSKEYDWFKGKNSGDKGSRKQGFKTFWKFTKIFLMFSLFFFSMWGCVQSMVIKTDPKIGNGIEFYNSESQVAPNTQEVELTKNANGIYSLNSKVKSNLWLNKFQHKNELSEVQKILMEEKNGSKHKLSDSFKGVNRYFRITDENNKFLLGDKTFFALSSIQKSYNGFNPSDSISSKSLNDLINSFKLTQIDMNIFSKPTDWKSLEFNDSNYGAMSNSEKAAWEYQASIIVGLNNFFKNNSSYNYLMADVSSISSSITKEQAIAHNNTWKNLLSFFSIKSEAFKNKVAKSTFIPNIFKSTSYRPIITWGQAWTRGVGPFYGLFVWPISKMSIAITDSFGMHNGWESLLSIVLIVFILRIFSFMLTFKSILQQTKQQEMQAKKAVIDAKYVNYKGNKQMEARQRQEVSELYKKEGISPFGAIGAQFVTMPIFLSIWRVISALPHLKGTTWLGINFSETSWRQLFAGEFQYLPLMVCALGFSLLSQLYPRLLTKRRDKNRINVHQKAAMKKNNKTQNIIMGVFVVMSLIFNAGTQIYWIVGGIWQVIQATISHHVVLHSRNKSKNRVKI